MPRYLVGLRRCREFRSKSFLRFIWDDEIVLDVYSAEYS